MDHFWKNIQRLMETFDVTQDTVARISGVTPSSVSRWKNGTIPRVDKIQRLCDYFHLTPDDLLSDRLGLANQDDTYKAIERFISETNKDGHEALIAVANSLKGLYMNKDDEDEKD